MPQHSFLSPRRRRRDATSLRISVLADDEALFGLVQHFYFMVDIIQQQRLILTADPADIVRACDVTADPADIVRMSDVTADPADIARASS